MEKRRIDIGRRVLVGGRSVISYAIAKLLDQQHDKIEGNGLKRNPTEKGYGEQQKTKKGV